MTRVIYHQLSVPAPLERVWELWTVASEVEKWFAPIARIEPKIGGQYELFFVPSNLQNKNTEGCHIVHMTPQKDLTFTWKGPSQFAELMNAPVPQTTVNLRFKQNLDGTTCVKLFHRGFGDDESWDYAYDWHQLAWAGVLNHLYTKTKKSDLLLGFSPEESQIKTVSCVG